MASSKFTAAAVHASPIYMNKAATLEKVVQLIGQGAMVGTSLMVFPETFVPGYPYFTECYPPLKQVGALSEYIDQSVVVDPDKDLKGVVAACRKYHVAISLGISERVAGGYTIFNSQVTIDSDGTILGVHRKLQPTFVERAVWAQGGGQSLRNFTTKAGYRIGGLCCWENTMNGARQALIETGQQIHAGAWPALSTMAGFEAVADAQIEALMKSHALTAQVFVLCSSNYVDESCLQWMEKNLGEQSLVKAGGGWTSIIHPFCSFLAGPVTGEGDQIITAEIDLSQLNAVKVWIDAKGHYKRPEVLSFTLNERNIWPDEKT
ncbi:carbon-nitrogen hydrolase [Saccharata proteae CBS 121410]|uniref:Carbon-nitrogen hydrolase n=1 Tax=Saccharata proteae CBS 121410 TaxID=1314787 RepID=A0A6A5YD26_9PEZI|nr:carbon-nitrogen hydrolase [Saccharata proteae CBS 121410]